MSVVHVPRAQFRDTIQLRGANGVLRVPPDNAVAAIYNVDTSTPIPDTIYANDWGPETKGNPMPLGHDGLLEFWLDVEREFDIEVTCPGYTTVRTTATSDAAAGLGSVLVNPTIIGTVYGHPEWDESQHITINQPFQPLIDHNSLANLDVGDPHPQYDDAGSAAIGDANHVAAADPHPQYLTQAEADARYALNTGGALGVDNELRAYIQQIMSVIDPGGPPAPV